MGELLYRLASKDAMKPGLPSTINICDQLTLDANEYKAGPGCSTDYKHLKTTCASY